ncbi:extracellular solute-binding protein [Myceligenerans crystallogenes]|uniref:extracellular solute-binding protein n=1 Tax=Myceligenerans crystallogenes TaxID=316335 RepID=UPI0031DBC6E2
MLSAAACTKGLDADDGGRELRVLIGPSRTDETASLRAAVREWSAAHGRDVTVDLAADIPRQLTRGFAAGNAPDVFALGTDHFAEYAAAGFLEPYGDALGNTGDFHPALVTTFTVDGELVCAPREFSTLALVIDATAWKRAGLTPGDYPATWDDLHRAAKRLTTGERAGLTFPPEWERIGAFMAAAGGGLVDERLRPAADTPENLRALSYAKDLLVSGAARFPSEVGAGWGGEALGTGAAAMTIEGNWVIPALREDYPDVEYAVVPLPHGPAGPATLGFTECWGIAADGRDHGAAVSLVRHLTSARQQTEFARDYGAMPSVRSAAEAWAAANPGMDAFLDGAAGAQGVPPMVGLADALPEVNARLAQLPEDDPKAVLTEVQSALEAAN